MGIDLKVIDKLLAEHGHRPEDIAGEKGLLKQLTKALLERAMQAEMTGHLGYEKHDPVGHNSGNSRNGKSRIPRAWRRSISGRPARAPTCSPSAWSGSASA